MNITIWSDFVCPFCIIGEAHLKKALKNFAHADKIKVEYKSFLLMPDAKYIPDKSYAETFSQLKGMPLKQAETMLQQVTEQAKKSGVEINYDIAKIASTADAHRVFQYAKVEGLGNQFFSRFYKAHFSEGENLSDHSTILQLAKEIGLNESQVQQILEHNTFEDEVNQDLAEARTIGVQGVPFFVLNNKYVISGAQPLATFEQAIEQVWEKEQDKNN